MARKVGEAANSVFVQLTEQEPGIYIYKQQFMARKLHLIKRTNTSRIGFLPTFLKNCSK
jgi:hypothetical protein